MTPRIFSTTILAVVLALGVNALAKENKTKKAARTWKTVVDYVMKNGAERTLKAPLSRKLGFDSDAVLTKALRYKTGETPDKKSHAIYVVFANDKDGNPSAKEIILGNGIVTTKDGLRSVDDLFIRTDLSGKIIAAISSTGPAGHVDETILAPESDSALAAFNGEKAIHFDMDLKKLSK